MNRTFDRYVDTIFHMWKKDPEFKDTFKSSKGFCTYHYGILYDTSVTKLSKNQCEEFIEALNHLYFENMERVQEISDGSSINSTIDSRMNHGRTQRMPYLAA